MEDLQKLEQNLESRLENLWNQYQKGFLSKGDIVSLYLLTYNDLFPVDNWLCWSRTRSHLSQALQSWFFPKQNADWTTCPLIKKIPRELSLGQIMNQSVFKKETLRSSLGLVHIFAQPDTVKILDYIPTPLQLLEMQACGFRCVTLLRTQNWFRHSFDHRRNLRDFVVHDLEHIWQMFENPELTQRQVDFSKKLYELTMAGEFNSLRNDPNFSGEFNYIISDMNTHPAHMFATLKSLIQRQKSQSEDILIQFEHLRN